MTKLSPSRGNRQHRKPPASAALFDEWLVMMAMDGQAGAGERLYKRWNPRLARAARRYGMADDEARDLAQECWLAIFKGLARLRDPKLFRSYAFAILHRRGCDHLRRVMRERSAVEEHMQVQHDNDPDTLSERAAITQAFASLPTQQRIAAHLHFVEGLTLREIAQIQGIPEGTAKSRIFNARSKLKAALGSNT